MRSNIHRGGNLLSHRRAKKFVIGKLKSAPYAFTKNLSEMSQIDFKNQVFDIFQYVLGVFPSSFSHPGWGPATAELQTNNYERF